MKKQDIPAGILPAHNDLFYGGAWHRPQSGQYLPTRNPAEGEDLMDAAQAGAQDVDAAVRAAQAAFPAWAAMPPRERAALLKQAAGRLRQHVDDLALLDSLNNGNPVRALRPDVLAAADGLEYFAGLATEIKGETIPMGAGALNFTLQEPLGVVARITAYNHPLMFAALRIAAPLAAGNCVVVKSPDQAPLSTYQLAELIGDIFPAGVVNFLSGSVECGAALTTHPLVRKVTLIGGVPTGKAVMAGAAQGLKPVLLELGGKNALIVYPDADRDAAIEGIVNGMNFTWSGQSCGSTSRVFLHESVYDDWLPRIVEAVQARHRPGDPTDPSTTMGALVSPAQLRKVEYYVGVARDEGAQVLCGGKRPDDAQLAAGCFFEPTVLGGVDQDMRIANEEVFGPIMSVLKWKDEDALYEQVNRVDFGLTGSIWTRDLDTAMHAARRIMTGYVWINHTGQHFLGAPFGGVKQSGIGREECFAELLEFTYSKNVHVRLS
ncbi:2-formylbenzoate dehydrogenase [Pigmentiphaga humi]|uniref:2-formylbenzoate dehydrogenase n=1 Tax=Pigmentiphaga humi TaxID=2478468 RepID=A0A3P4B2R2_9BURK|nr:aldehyde dehydrogenase family protein [Pigmentiphaga humi]VCU69836.1 2-formylbenzoate dehydrogenase [Pigmentiphaga humi]